MAKTEQLTKNFTLDELTASATAKRLGIDNTPNAEQLANIRKLADVLQKIRDAFGRPIVINSAFRCEKLNNAVGGAKNSDHKYGAAADIQSVGDKFNKELWKQVNRLVQNGKIELRQIIDEYKLSWIHVSINHKFNEYRKNQVLYITK